MLGLPQRKTLRLSGYDYSQVGYYFVTICTQERESYLGDVIEENMLLNDAGRMVGRIWGELPERFGFVEMDEFVIMPNHLHGIVVIDPGDHKNFPCGDRSLTGEHKVRPYNNQLKCRRGEPCVRPLSGTKECSLGRVIQGFKSITTHEYSIGVNNHQWSEFNKRLWQRNYYERVIRTERELEEIREYIVENPVKWDADENNIIK